jgi:anti-anti-sigma factor
MKIDSTSTEVICFLEGRLDTIVSQNIEPEIDKATDPQKTMIFDFSAVGYISSTFLRICLKKIKELGAQKFYIRNPSPDIKKVFKIAGLEMLIKD